MASDPVQIAAHHVQDAAVIVLPFGKEIALPNILGFQVTKLMAMEVVAALLMVLIFVPLAWKIRTGKPPRGRWWNLFEAMILFIRNQVVRPAIGGREADRFLPFILTVFFFILFCNLLGLLPWLGSPTGSINVTGALAAIAFAVVIGTGMKKHGLVKFWAGLCPPMDVPKPMGVFLIPMILAIEIMGLLIRHTILAVRLLANMFAGHLVVGVIVAFIPVAVGSTLWYGVTPAAVFGATALNLLELFVAFLQAYVFAFLTALFIGMSIHQH
ncbi:MAG: F0F1 ATP synthase subunit A [Planctomycetaceae bacterium]|nr:F0F1 ATP synthase subunit A [Planctomycetaceae bacterium]